MRGAHRGSVSGESVGRAPDSRSASSGSLFTIATIAPIAASESRHEIDAAAAGLLALLCASWGLSQVAVKIAGAGISPATQAGLRSIGSTVLLVLWARWRGIPIVERDRTLLPGLAAGLLFAAEFLLVYTGLTFTTASRGVIFLYTAPFVTAVGAHLFVPGDRLTPGRSAGLAIAFAGIVVAFADALRLPTRVELLGDLLCLGGAIAWGATTVLVKASRLRHASAVRTLFYQLATSAVLLPVFALATGESGITRATPLIIGALAYQIIVIAFASYAAWFWLVTRYPASRLAAFTFLTPILGVAAGGIVLGEPIGPGLIVALVLIAAGIYLVNRPPRGGRESSVGAGRMHEA
jgi:drug/metabolite transporter (DMT)-like permease